jgi:hypothetical protein
VKLDAQWASSPTDHLMRYILQDIAALDYLRLNNSEHTPKLLATSRVSGSEDYDQIAMPGGYMVCILMTKLPGEQLDYYKFCNGLGLAQIHSNTRWDSSCTVIYKCSSPHLR